MIAIKRVRTRDSRLVRFDRSKILSAILEAMSSLPAGVARADDGAGGDLPEELTDAVIHFLDRSHRDDLEVEHIHDMIEKVLMETGHRDIARAYILLRERRARSRESIRVRPEAAPERAVAPFVEGRHDFGEAIWDRHRMTAALIEEGDVDGETAAEIAAVVERRVLRSGLQSISTALIRELVDNELFERGFTKSLRRQGSMAVPKYDLEQLLFHGGERATVARPANPRHATELLGDMILRQYVLEEVFSAPVRRAHHIGSLHVHQLGRALQLLRMATPAGLLVERRTDAVDEPRPRRRGAPRESFFLALLRGARELAPAVSEEIEIVAIGPALHRERRRRPSSAGADPQLVAGELLQALAEHREAAPRGTPGCRLRLRIPFLPQFVEESGEDLFPTATFREETSLFLVEVLRVALSDPRGPELLQECVLVIEVSAVTFGDRRFAGALEAVLRALPREAPLEFSIAGVADAEAPRRSTVAGKVTINLPHVVLACRGGEGETHVRDRLADAARLAVTALRERCDFLARAAVHPEGPFAELQRAGGASGSEVIASASHALGIIGLDDAVRIHCGESLHESDAARHLAAQWLDELRAAVEETARQGAGEGIRPLEVFLEETPNRGPLRRLESLDGDRFPPRSADGDGHRLGPDEHYCSGARLRRWAPIDPLEAWAMLDRLRGVIRLSGRLDDTTRLRAEGVEVLLAFLEEICHLRRRAAEDSGDRPSSKGNVVELNSLNSPSRGASHATHPAKPVPEGRRCT